MAHHDNLQVISGEAGSDLSASQYCAVIRASDGQYDLASAGGPIDGVLQDKPSAAGKATSVGINGVSKAKVGAAVTDGDDLAVGSGGKLVTATTGDVVVARAHASGSDDGSVIPVLLRPNLEPLS